MIFLLVVEKNLQSHLIDLNTPWYLLKNQIVPDGTVNRQYVTAFLVPDLPSGTSIGIRFRISNTANIGATGFVSSGEVEDYIARIE